MEEEIIVEKVDYKAKFVDFFKGFKDVNGRYKYRERIREMAANKEISLVVDFDDLISYDGELSKLVIERPTEMIKEASEALMEVLKVEHSYYASQVDRLTVRFRGLPETQVVSLRGLRSEHIGKLITVEGIVTRITPVKHLMVEAAFKDHATGEVIKVKQEGDKFRPLSSQALLEDNTKKRELELVPEESKFIDWQKVVIQERPEELPPGQLPRSIEVILKDDLVDKLRPGDRAVVTGILRVIEEKGLKRNRPPIFKTYIDANYVETPKKDVLEIEISEEDERRILELSQDKDIKTKIIRSIAPSIYGYEKIKEAIACLLFGGVPKVFPDGVRVRGDIHILLVGDPGTAKSQLLKYVASISPRGVFTTGKGSTAAGLTAAVVREKSSGEFFLEAGALVLADGGVACIDEFDKMDPRDRVSIHEAMEQQSYHKDFELILADGRKVRIGEFVDRLIRERRGEVIKGRDTEVLKVNDIYLLAYDPLKKDVIIAKADRVSRHKAPSRFIKLYFSNGRSITVTPEHPIVIWDGNGFATVRAEEVKPGTLVPGVLKYKFLSGQKVPEPLNLFLKRAFSLKGNSELEVKASLPSLKDNYVETSSRAEAEGLQDALLALGIPSRIITKGGDYLVILEEPERNSRGNLKLLKVEKVEELSNNDSEWVYDVTVEPYHLFVSHGLVLHNTISIAKAGIVATLNTRTSILAAANPAFGRYMFQRTIAENIDLPVTILSRFDLIFVITDEPQSDRDLELAQHVVELHSKALNERYEDIIPPELLKKYIAYARKYIKPKLSEEAKRRIVEFYVEMRRKSENPESPIAITPRQLEALIRLAEAQARMKLKDIVTIEDVEAAIDLMLYFLRSVGLDTKTKAIDIDIVMTGKPKSQREKFAKLMELIKAREEESKGKGVKIEELIKKGEKEGLERAFIENALRHLKNEGEIYEPRPGYIKRT